jgi:hypothetical protein
VPSEPPGVVMRVCLQVLFHVSLPWHVYHVRLHEAVYQSRGSVQQCSSQPTAGRQAGCVDLGSRAWSAVLHEPVVRS